MNTKFDFNKNLYPNVKYMNGPFLRNDGRLMLTCVLSNNKKTSISYPKYLKENELGRKLSFDETIDHIDGDPLNNDLDNLRVMNRSEHAKNDVKRVTYITKTVYCQYCHKPIEFTRVRARYSNRKGHGYFCSRQCSGKYGSEIQRNKRKHKFVQKPSAQYINNHSMIDLYNWDNCSEFTIFDIIEDLIFSMFK
jgi:hypothetical protein